MSKDTLKVLEMLEAGKITTAQAEQLLEVLRESSNSSAQNTKPPDEDKFAESMTRVLTTVTTVVPQAIDAAMSRIDVQSTTGTSEKNKRIEIVRGGNFERNFADAHDIVIAVGAGDVSAAASDDEQTHVSMKGAVASKIDEQDQGISVKCAKGDVTVELPELETVKITTGSGDIEIDDITVQAIVAQSGKGDITASFAATTAKFTTGYGDFDITCKNFSELSAKTGYGDIEITSECAFRAEIHCIYTSEVSLTGASQIISDGNDGKSRKIIAEFGENPSATCVLATGYGDIDINYEQ